MEEIIKKLPSFVNAVKKIKETIITNIVFIGQTPSPTFQEQHRTQQLMERLVETGVDECTTDGYQNPIGLIRGTSDKKPPIFAVTHLDTFFEKDIDHNFMVKKNSITGPGILDNAVGVGVLASLPEVFRILDIRFESDIVLAGVIQSIGKGNLRGIRHLLKTWETPVRGAVCIEGGELGRLNYATDGMKRCEIICDIMKGRDVVHKFKPNAILILHQIIEQILKMRLPQKPRSRVIIGKISGGYKHGLIACDATLGFEIQSDSDRMVKTIFKDINDIVDGISHETQVDLKLKTISTLSSSRLRYNHPLVKNTVEIMKTLNLKPVSTPSESELSIFLSRKIPAVTLGVTKGENYHLVNAKMEIDPMFTGIAQIVGVLMAIDKGVCDER